MKKKYNKNEFDNQLMITDDLNDIEVKDVFFFTPLNTSFLDYNHDIHDKKISCNYALLEY